MSRSPARLALSLAAVLALAFAGAGRAAAEDEVVQPDHSASDMSITAESHPKDLTPLPEAEKERPAAEKAIREAIEALAAGAKIAMSEITVEVTSVRYGEAKTATFALVDVYTKPGDFRKGLEEKAKASGWAFREMASPVRLLVVAGPAEDLEKLVAAQVRHAGMRLAETGHQRIQNGFPERAASYAKTALALVPGLAYAHFVVGVTLMPGGQGPHAAADYDAAMAEFRKALDEKSPEPLAPALRASVRGDLGNILLNAADGKPSEEARDHLKYAVEHASDIPHVRREAKMGWTYNLACAHGRLKELDAAFPLLKAVLEEDKKETIPGIDHWRRDPDFENLKADPRWNELLAAFPEGSGGGGNPHDGGGN